MGPDYYWPVHWWELLSVWLAKRLNPYHVCMLLYRCWQNEAKQHKTITTYPPHSSINNKRAKNNVSEERNGIIGKGKNNIRILKERKVIMRGERERELVRGKWGKGTQ